MIDTSATDNRIFQLVEQVAKCYCEIRLHHLGKQTTQAESGLLVQVAKCYCEIRLHHLGKQTTQAESGLLVRKELNKLVLFKHQ